MGQVFGKPAPVSMHLKIVGPLWLGRCAEVVVCTPGLAMNGVTPDAIRAHRGMVTA
jgi:hypothetical protein